MLIFDPSKGIIIEDESKVREEVTLSWQNAFAGDNLEPLDTSATSPAGQIIDSQTAAIAKKDRELLYLANQFNPETAEGMFQDALGKIYFINRKLAEPTIVECICTGSEGTVIPKGSLVKTEDNLTLISSDDATIASAGSVNIIFNTLETGIIIIGANSVNKIVSVTPGWDTVNNLTAGITGRDIETRAAFEARRKESISKNSRGSLAAIVGSLWDIPNIIAIKGIENSTRNPITSWGVTVEPFGFLISIYGGADTDIARVIYNKKNEGSTTTGNKTIRYIASDYNNAIYDYNILRPELLPFKINVTIRKYISMPSNIATLIKTVILDNFEGRIDDPNLLRVKMAQIVYASRFYPTVVDLVKQNLVSVKISTDATNFFDEITVNADTMPTLSLDDVNVDIL